MSKAAPDVDLQERGLPRFATAIGVGLVGIVLVYIRGWAGSSAETEVSDTEVSEGASGGGWLISILWMLFQLFCLLFAMVLGLLITRQRSILYCPTPPGMQRSTKQNPAGYRSPDSWRVPYEEVEIVTEDSVKLNAWLICQPTSATVDPEDTPFTFVFFHGNAGNIGFRLENLRDMQQQLKVNVLIVDYRGYGDSEDGSGPCQTGFIKDAVATYRWIVDFANDPPESAKTRIRADRILIFGRSVGGAVGIHLFHHLLKEKVEGRSKLPLPAGIVLENTFTSLRDMALTLFPFLAPLRLVIRPPLIFDPWNSAECLDYICSHTEHWCCCLFSGAVDEIVPPAQMKQLHGILKKSRPKVLKFFSIPTGGHNDTPGKGGQEYWESFRKFLALVRETEEDRAVAHAD
mmetsp:Transcript_18303/g.42741  ORF Transcript_18303/g.42741 Transcript_18303/m.42741 type:complete len:403 (-) Transcript_18303:57-1265(-)